MKYGRIALSVLIILAVGAVLDVVVSKIYWKMAGITDGPWWVGFLIFGFGYVCALPGLLVPYAILARTRGPAESSGIVASICLSLAFPAWLLFVAFVLGGLERSERLVESLGGWTVLIAVIVPPGVLLSHCALGLERLSSQSSRLKGRSP